MEQTQSVQQLIHDISAGRVLLPEFQRDFVWEITKTYDLFDSIVKDIFVGAIIYGIPSFEIAVREIDKRPKAQRGKRRLPLSVRTIPKQEIDEMQRLDRSNFRLLLDGQQRSTALYRAVMGIDPVWFIAKNGGELENEFEKSAIEDLLYEFSGSQDSERISIRLSDVWKIDEDDLDDEEVKNYFQRSSYYERFSSDEEFDERAEFKKYRYLKKKVVELFKQEKLLSYYLLDMSLEKFVVFFERSNTRGVQLNFIDILAAKLYTGNFNLKQKIQDFQQKHPNHHLVPETIVRTIAYLKSSAKEVDRNYILTKLKAEDFIELWDILCESYRVTLDFLYENHLIISQDWMPYENMLIPLMVFLREIGGSYHSMSQNQKDFLVFWYLNSVFSLRYSGATNERIIEDATIFGNIANGKKITSPTFFNKLTKSQVANRDDIYSFEKKGNAVYKGILNLINYHSGGLIDWNNDSRLSLNSELEDHHIFPRAFLEKTLTNEVDKDFIDCVGNRTLVPKRLNIKISAQKPSDYLAQIKRRNPSFDRTLENHLIPKEVLAGELDNEYKFFLDMRIEEIFRIIQLHLIEPTSNIKEAFLEEIRVEDSLNIPVFSIYRGNRADATFNPASHKLFYSGKVFDSPSAAANFVKTEFGAPQDNTENGWTFWRFVDDNDEERRIIEFREELASKEVHVSDELILDRLADAELDPNGRPKSVWNFTETKLVDKKRDDILAEFARNRDLTFVKKGRASRSSADGNFRVVCTISKHYDEPKDPYWFGYDHKWRDFLCSSKDGFLVLGCMDLSIAFAVPASVLENKLPELNTTDNDRGMWWHLNIRQLENQSYVIVSRSGDHLDLTPFTFSFGLGDGTSN
jgi:hypothetical protein